MLSKTMSNIWYLNTIFNDLVSFMTFLDESSYLSITFIKFDWIFFKNYQFLLQYKVFIYKHIKALASKSALIKNL